MIIHGDSFEEVKSLEDNSIDALVTDPPYGLSAISQSAFVDCMVQWCQGDEMYMPKAKGFMGKSWDGFVPPPGFWREVFRVMKPGAHGLVFAGSRTQDIMGLSLRLAGFEMRDCVTWLYGSGFPKSHDISKAIDKLKGEERVVVGKGSSGKTAIWSDGGMGEYDLTAPSSKEAKQWEGWGTALKPAYEPALLIRKPFKSSVAQNVLEHGTGGINIDGCRIGKAGGTSKERKTTGADSVNCYGVGLNGGGVTAIDKDRFPSNVLMDDEASDMLDNQSRFFYTAKASPAERSAGLHEFEEVAVGTYEERSDGSLGKITVKRNIHPTVKPIEIMRYLCRLITPPNGTILEPFLGSGTTAIAALKEGFEVIGIEREEEYVKIAQARLKYWAKHDHAMTPQNPPTTSDQLELF